MKKSDFDYFLPDELIAQTPLEPRDSSKLLVFDRESKQIEHRNFYNIIDYLSEGDVLVFNNSKVIPARVYGGFKNNPNSKIEFLFLKQIENDIWEVLVKPGKKAKLGSLFTICNGEIECEVIEIKEDGNRVISLKYKGNFYEILENYGKMPLPPYIKEKLKDSERYQTVYAKPLGSAAAPTAGLHFTQELLDKIKDKGVKFVFVTLHVGLGTFRSVRSEDIQNHEMHSEHFCITKDSVNVIKIAKENKNKIFCVGTTSCRVLEGVYQKFNDLREFTGETNIFIYPEYKFNVVDCLITNFHLPESTLIMLVSAFGGYFDIMNLYKIGIDKKYRFFSFGDSMLIK